MKTTQTVLLYLGALSLCFIVGLGFYNTDEIYGIGFWATSGLVLISMAIGDIKSDNEDEKHH